MLKRTIVIVMGLLLSTPLCWRASKAIAADEPATPATQPSDPSGEAALAEHFAQMAQLTLATRTINAAVWQECIALLQCATKLDPDEARYWRLLAEANLQDRDRAAALWDFQAA